MKITYPSKGISCSQGKVEIQFSSDFNDEFVLPENLAVPVFFIDNIGYVVFHHLSTLWGYPSSYQLILKILKKSSLNKNDILKSDPQLTYDLYSAKLIPSIKSYFYIELKKLYLIIENKQIFLADDYMITTTNTNPPLIAENPSKNGPDPLLAGHSHELDDDGSILKHEKHEQVTIGQVFPQYGLDDLPPNHGNYNCLTNSSKLNFFKEKSLWKFLPNNKLSFEDRELVLNDNPQLDFITNNDSSKSIANSKKSNSRVDPNSIDLTESIIPGQGYVQEFNVNHLCKVPNYYIASATQPINQLKLANSVVSNTDNVKVPRNIQQLVNNNDPEAINLSRYFYTKSFRGPGSGNYKDAALTNRINRIPLTNDIVKNRHKVTKDLKKMNKNRANQNLKGLTHEFFNKYMVDHLLKSQNDNIQDYQNLEMLHNNLLFNLLLNSYREISKNTWKSYFDFKMTDYEQINAIKVKKLELEKRQNYEQELQNWKQKEMKRVEKDSKEMDRIQRVNFENQQILMEKKQQLQSHPSPQTEKKLQELESKYAPEQFKPSKPIPPPKQVETINLDISSKFTLPSMHPEIMKNMPIELRKTGDNPCIKGPVSYITNYADPANPQILNRIEIIKLPNLNEIGWENLRRYKSIYD